jgi:hypothetical protein
MRSPTAEGNQEHRFIDLEANGSNRDGITNKSEAQ